MLFFFTSFASALQGMNDEEIRKAIIQDSVSQYEKAHGKSSCPCPYSLDKNDEKCGFNSAYFQNPEETKPLCYNKDIPEHAVDDYRAYYKIPNEK